MKKPFAGNFLKKAAGLGLIAIVFSACPMLFADSIKTGDIGECTVGIFSAAVTPDGRPVLWKNRDVSDFDQRFIFYDSYERDGITTFPFIGDVYRSDTTGVYMGANEAGFAIMNSDSYNLGDSVGADGITDGVLMRLALETCVRLADFENLLDSTNITGRRDCWNFGVIDSYGGCAMYECANFSYVKAVPEHDGSPAGGFIIRANFSLSGGLPYAGEDRYSRAISLTLERLDRGYIDPAFVLGELVRDLFNEYDNPYPLPYEGSQLSAPPGYIYNVGGTIARRFTSAAVVIRGTAPGEDPALATVFAVLGSPTLSVAYPLWVKSRSVPVYLSHPDGAPMYEYCRMRSARLYDNPGFPFHINSRALLDESENGIYSYTLPLELWAIDESDRLLAQWERESANSAEVAIRQNQIADVIFRGFRSETIDFLPPDPPAQDGLPERFALFNYPNPFNGSTTIAARGINQNSQFAVRIYDVLGRLVRQIYGTFDNGGVVVWRGDDNLGNEVGSGIYFYSLQGNGFSASSKMAVLR